MPVYKITEEDFEPLDRTSFEVEKLMERGDMQRRLRDRPEMLEKGLYILAEEYGNWEESNRRIDLLALDGEGRLVVVELKRSDSDSLMDLQAIRYAAMVARMTFRHAVDAHSQYLISRGMDGTQAESLIRQHLTADDEDPAINSDIPRIFLVSASFSKELTTSVMWLNERPGMSITCVKLQPYRSTDDLFLESSQVIPIPEASEYLIQLRNWEEEAHQRQIEGSRVETSKGAEQFQKAIDSANYSQREKLTLLHEMALALQADGLAELSTRSGSYNTVLRIRFPGSSRGLVNVFKNESGWGYLQFNVSLLDSRAPNSKARLEEIIGPVGRTLWELPDGFIEVLSDAYREANGQPIPSSAIEFAQQSESKEDLERLE